MKSSILFSMLILAGSFIISSEASAQKGFYISAQGAPLLSVKFNSNDVHNDNMDYKAKSSYTFGIGGGYNLSDNFGVGAELMYSKEKQGYSDGHVSYTEQVKYLKIPVIATFNTNPAARIMFTAKAGPQLGFHLKSSITNSSDPLLNGNTKDQYRKVNLGAMFGTGARVRITDNLYADAGLRFDGTITNLEKNQYRNISNRKGGTHAVNAGVEVGVRYYL